MCNEFRFKQTLDRLLQVFGALDLPLRWEGGAPNLEPRDSIRPTEPASVIVGAPDDGAELKQMRWGFIQPGRPPVINFRSEGRRFTTGRCLVPVDGFYEFTGAKAPKSKWLFTRADAPDDFFCLGGLVRDDRFTLLTTASGPDIAPYHDRQVVVVPRSKWAAWLGSPEHQPEMRPLPAGALKVVQIR